MEHIIITWRELLLAGILVLSIYIAEMLLLLRRRHADGEASAPSVFRENRKEPDLKQEIAQLASRVELLEQRLATLQAEQADAEQTPYQRAIQMARQGRDASRIAQSCGISQGEAELIVSVHGAQSG